MMNALVVEGKNRISQKQVAVPDLKDDEVLCRVIYSGVCGTDLAIYTGETNFVRDGLIKYPVRIGHEWSGYAEKIGRGVTGFKKGDRVVADNGIVCRKCPACLRKDYKNCADIRCVGTINCWDGSFAEYIVIPECHLYHLPDSISYKKGALIEPLTIAYSAMTKYKVTSGTTVAVIGTGPIGQSSVAIAAQMGADRIISIGRTQRKLDTARSLGATDTVNINETDAEAEIFRITNGRGADYVVETSGAETTVQQAIDIAAKRGTLSMVGFYETEINSLILNRLVTKELTMRGVMGELGTVPIIIDYIEQFGLDIEPMITRIIDLGSAVGYFEDHKKTHKEDIKVLVRISDERPGDV
jgi:L-iditol 2-dehydrogenase